ncbi:hypothetical protein MKX03_011263 [Papaver bracteatum]|nr:hypothetical protein MKX03_011263 [Papaver bracteatum]
MKLQIASQTVKSTVDLELEQRLARLLVRGEKDGDHVCRKLEQCDNLNTHSEFILRDHLKDWVFEGYRTCKPFDTHGQAVLHLSACLGYTWAIAICRMTSFGVNYRDRTGWTPLHWAAFYGRQGAATLLLIHGANPSLITKSNAEYPFERTAASIASERGHDDLANYLSDIVDNPEKIVRLSTIRAKLVGVQRPL